VDAWAEVFDAIGSEWLLRVENVGDAKGGSSMTAWMEVHAMRSM
jgi:hypothetical protein